MPSGRPAPPRSSSPSTFTRLRILLLLVMACFVFPLALFARVSGEEGGARIAAVILVLALPATGSVLLRLKPDLAPGLARLREVRPAEWVNLAALAALLGSAAWWIAGAIAAR